MKPHQVFAAIMIAAGVLCYFSHQDLVLVRDGQVRFNTLSALLEHGKLSGTHYSMVMPLCAVPLYLLGRLAGNAAGGVALFSLVVTLLFIPLFWKALRVISDAETAALTSVLLLGDSMLLACTPYFLGEPFSVALMGLAIVWYRTDRPRLAAGALVLSAANLPATLVGASLLCLRWSWQQQRLRWLLLPLLVLLEFGLESWLFRSNGTPVELHRLGHPSILPYSDQPYSFAYPWLLGVLNQLFSFGKGLLFFSPGLLLAGWVRARLRENERQTLDDMVLYLAGLVAVYAHWTNWDGGDYWGPRYLLFASLPSSLLLAVALRDKARSASGLLLTAGVLAASAWVGIDGTVYNLNGLESFMVGNRESYYFATYSTVEFSPLFYPFIQGLTNIESTARGLVFAFFLLGNLALALPLFQQMVDRALEFEWTRIEWEF